jgi:DNA-binding GntR family transcriptional regulator
VSIPIEDARDIVDIRALLEGLATELAVGRLAVEQFAQLRRLLPDSVMHKDVERAKMSVEKNVEFHWVIINACGRNHLKRILRQVWELQGTSRWVQMTTEEERAAMGKRDSVEHAEIVDALEEAKGAKARRLAVRHIQNSIEAWIAVRARLDNVADEQGHAKAKDAHGGLLLP